jgi:hypothetical protein
MPVFGAMFQLVINPKKVVSHTKEVTIISPFIVEGKPVKHVYFKMGDALEFTVEYGQSSSFDELNWIYAQLCQFLMDRQLGIKDIKFGGYDLNYLNLMMWMGKEDHILVEVTATPLMIANVAADGSSIKTAGAHARLGQESQGGGGGAKPDSEAVDRVLPVVVR